MERKLIYFVHLKNHQSFLPKFLKFTWFHFLKRNSVGSTWCTRCLFSGCILRMQRNGTWYNSARRLSVSIVEDAFPLVAWVFIYTLLLNAQWPPQLRVRLHAEWHCETKAAWAETVLVNCQCVCLWRVWCWMSFLFVWLCACAAHGEVTDCVRDLGMFASHSSFPSALSIKINSLI